MPVTIGELPDDQTLASTEPGGKTELETANTPHLNALAARSSLGLSIPVLPGIAPGSVTSNTSPP